MNVFTLDAASASSASVAIKRDFGSSRLIPRARAAVRAKARTS
jgi:hypothetical protein